VEIRYLGTSGLAVGWLGLGTALWGRDTDEHEAAEQLRDFVESGGQLIDTGDAYGGGAAEAVVGALLAGRFARSDVVLAVKTGGGAPDAAAGDADLSRRGLLAALDGSLRRLGVDHIDLWQIDGVDPVTPLEETLSALDIAVSSGRVRYVGLANFCGWRTAKAAAWQAAWPGRARLISNQVEYSLLQRGVEREVVPAMRDAGMSILAWSPLGRGVLTGKYRTGIPADSRAASDHLAAFVQPYLGPESTRIVNAVCTAAQGLGVSPLAVALAWVRDRPGVGGVLVGARTAAQLRGILAECDLTLPAEISAALDEVSAVPSGYPERTAAERATAGPSPAFS